MANGKYWIGINRVIQHRHAITPVKVVVSGNQHSLRIDPTSRYIFLLVVVGAVETVKKNSFCCFNHASRDS